MIRQSLVILFFLLIIIGCNKPTNFNYKSQMLLFDSTATKPIVFAPNKVSTYINKFNISFSPDGKTIYYTATSNKLGFTAITSQEINSNKLPEFVDLGSYSIPRADVQISPDGNKLLFSTFENFKGKPAGDYNFNIWISERENNLWSKPKPFYPSIIASKGNEFYPILIEDGTLYFNSDREGNSDIYYSKFINGKYQSPLKLPGNINSPKREADAFIARDESYLIFVRVDESDGFGNSDLYISFRKGENEWSDPVNMGEEINSKYVDGSPYITADGKYLIFTSGRSKQGVLNKIESYKDFKKIKESYENGTLNFYYVRFYPEKYRKGN